MEKRKIKRTSSGGSASKAGIQSPKNRKTKAKPSAATKKATKRPIPSRPKPKNIDLAPTDKIQTQEKTSQAEVILADKSLSPLKVKTGYVALVGRPNAGKSTLLNRLLGQKVAIVSDKPQTTRLSILGIKTSERGQIIFIDNPGIHKPLHKLNKRMMSFVYSALETADVTCLLIDATQSYGHGDEFVLETLRQVTKPVFLLINKVDIIRKDKVLLIIDKYKDLFPFKEIIPISAVTGANLDVLEKCLYDRLPAADKIYGDQELSDQTERFLLAELIREKILAHVSMELPFVTAVYIDQVERRDEGARREQTDNISWPDSEDSTESATGNGLPAEYRKSSTAAGEIASEKPPEESDRAFASERTMEAAADRIVQEHLESAGRQTIRTGLPIESSFRPDKRFKGKKARQALPVTYVKASIFVERPSHRQIIIGRQGRMIKLIGIEARQDMEEYLDSRVYLDLQVKVRPNWRDSADVLDLIEGQK